MINIEQTCELLRTAQVTAEVLITECFRKIDDKKEQGNLVFTTLYKEPAIKQAKKFDILRKEGKKLPPFAGVPISIKDLFDIEGEPTTAGSKLLMDAIPAEHDATIVTNLRRAGFIILGRTNMTEFAYSGLGLNPHFGTPLNPYDRKNARIPGGSSSGAAVSITDSFVAGAIGTDTGGSCRIPAALCGIVGFKPTQKRVSLNGAFPLSPSLDSVGPLAATVESCAILDSIMSGEKFSLSGNVDFRSLKFALPKRPMLDDLDSAVSSAFEATVKKISDLGAEIQEINLPELSDIPHISKHGGIAAAEAYKTHKDMLEESFDTYDPRVSKRIMNWHGQTDDDYLKLMMERKKIIKSVYKSTAPFDTLISPTVPTVAPTITSLEDDQTYLKQNMLMLRNPSLINFLDQCSISLPCHEPGNAPVGFMLSGKHGNDKKLFDIAASLEKIIR